MFSCEDIFSTSHNNGNNTYHTQWPERSENNNFFKFYVPEADEVEQDTRIKILQDQKTSGSISKLSILDETICNLVENQDNTISMTLPVKTYEQLSTLNHSSGFTSIIVSHSLNPYIEWTELHNVTESDIDGDDLRGVTITLDESKLTGLNINDEHTIVAIEVKYNDLNDKEWTCVLFWRLSEGFYYLSNFDTTSGAFGDPHILTLQNKSYELSKTPAVYRLLQGPSITINGSTRSINKNEVNEIKQLEKKHNKKLVTDGTYFDELFINSDGHTIKFCFDTKELIKDEEYYNKIIVKSNGNTIDSQFDKTIMNKSSYFLTSDNDLIFNNSKHGQITITFENDINVMLKNNFKVKIQYPYNLSGLLTDEYLLETMMVHSLENTSPLQGKIGKNPVLSRLIKFN